MAEIPFHLTKMGRIFYEAQLPALIDAINNLAGKMGKLSDQLQFETNGALKINTTPPTVFVVSYRHRHGTDVWVRRTKERAMGSVADVIEYWLDEVDDHDKKKKIRELLDGNNVEAAIAIWEEATNEGFEVTEGTIDEPTETELHKRG